MKRIAILAMSVLAGAGVIYAQPRMGMGMGRAQAAAEAPKSVTIEGKLVFVDESPALQAKDKTYILRWRNFYYDAYKDGIKEGAQVKAEGYELPAFPGQTKPFFEVTKATVGSKTYEADDFTGRGMMMGPGATGGRGMMGGRGFDDDRRGGGMRGRGFNQAQPQAAAASTTLEGKLVIVDQSPAIQTKDKTYILRWPGFFYSLYADGIKEGVQVKVEGYAMPAFPGQDKPYFDVTKATIGAKTYEVDDFAGPGMMMGHGMPGMMGGRGGRW